MELGEKLQVLRKSRGLTQEELAQALYVSRTAVSKWESGRGYPSIDSLRELSVFFSVTIDELLSGEEALSLAVEESRQKEQSFCDLVWGLLDCCFALYFFLPLFAGSGSAHAVSLLALTHVQPYLKAAYFAILILSVLMGIAQLALQNVRSAFWTKYKSRFSLLCSVSAALLFIISRQPYAAALLFVFLIIKVFMLSKRR